MDPVTKLWKKKDCYKNSDYYLSLLPNYSWGGLSDLEYLKEYFKKNLSNRNQTTLELAAGNGRATRVIREYSKQITVLEINLDMLRGFILPPTKKLIIYNEDMNEFIKNNPLTKYSLIFSFWGPYISYTGLEILVQKMAPGSMGIFFHANRGREEQRLIRQILNKYKDKKYDPNKNTSEKENIFTKQLEAYKKSKEIDFSIQNQAGHAKFKSIDSAIESFLNFHLGGVFELEEYLKIYKFLIKILDKHKNEGGEIEIDSGMKIFKMVKL